MKSTEIKIPAHLNNKRVEELKTYALNVIAYVHQEYKGIITDEELAKSLIDDSLVLDNHGEPEDYCWSDVIYNALCDDNDFNYGKDEQDILDVIKFNYISLQDTF